MKMSRINLDYNDCKISVKLFNGSEIMQILLDDCTVTISEDTQAEIAELLLKLCENAVRYIEKKVRKLRVLINFAGYLIGIGLGISIMPSIIMLLK